jgi:hypothetical protein
VRSGRGGSEEDAGDGGSLNETHCDGWFCLLSVGADKMQLCFERVC